MRFRQRTQNNCSKRLLVSSNMSVRPHGGQWRAPDLFSWNMYLRFMMKFVDIVRFCLQSYK